MLKAYPCCQHVVHVAAFLQLPHLEITVSLRLPLAAAAGLCCQSLNQFGCGNACCNSFTQLCDQYRQICAERINTACVAGQIWCPGAQQCCPVNTLCSFNQCLPRNAIGRRKLHLKGLTAL